MKLKFNGSLERTTTGCAPCGTKKVSESVFRNSKTYYLPSGATLTFRYGQTYDVSEEDAEFLLLYNWDDDNGVNHRQFEVIE